MYPGYGWAVYSPTDTWTQNDNEAHWCWVDNGPAPADIRDRVYIGPSWYCQPLVRAMLEYKEISRHHIKFGWRPTRTLPEDTFERPMQKILDELQDIGTEEAEKLCKTLPNSLIGYMVFQDEPCEFRYSCSQDPGERPPCSIELPGFLVEEFGMHEWCRVVEQRSYDSLRPIHSQIMGIARLRMVQLAKLLIQTLGRPLYLNQAKTDAWYVSCPPKLRDRLETLKPTYRQLFGVACDDPAIKVTLGTPNYMQNISDIRHNWQRPEAVKWKRHDSWEHLNNFTLIGPAGTGKTFLLLQIADQKRKNGKKVYMIAFTNAVCCQLAEAITVHKFLRLAYRGDLETPCTVIWDEVFYVNTYTLARMAPLRMLDIQWIFAGDHKQLEMPGHWRGQVCKNNLFGSSYLPPDYVELTEPKRTIDPCFWAFQMRVRNATEEELPEIKAECKKRFRAQGPFEMTICLSHAKRRRLNDGQRKEGLEIPCTDSLTGSFMCHSGLRLVGTSRAKCLVNGMQYEVLEARLPHILLEELEPRANETHCRHIEITPEKLGQEATVAYAVTNAGVQGKTCRKQLRICDVDNPYMTAQHLYVAISRATEERNVRIQ